jgi:membrane-associated phospholipid phosphatase
LPACLVLKFFEELARKKQPTALADSLQFERFPARESLIALGMALVYLIWVWLAVGLRSDHLVFTGLCLGLYFLHPLSRKLVLALFFFVIYWVIYDSMRVYPNHLFNPVHIAEPYNLEKALFGFTWNGQVVTPNEYFAQNTHPVLDVLSGFFYLSWVPVPLAFAVWLYFKDKRTLLDFSLAFLLTNIFGFILYYLYPAAPPWYVELYGFQENFSIPGNEAGLANFDQIMGVQLFHGMYARNANVFAAIPSLHSAYPLITLYFAVKKRLKLASWMFLIILAGIWFSAVYSRHHYIIDVLLGALCAVATIIVFEKIILKSRINSWLDKYARIIT